MATLLLIRHGQASFGTDHYDRLSALGERQARQVGEHLRSAGVVLTAAFSGTLERQRRTAELALAAYREPPSLRVDERFNEIDVDAQLDVLSPEVIAEQPQLAAHAARAQTSSKDYQKLLRAVFGRWVGLATPPASLRSYSAYAQQYWQALEDAMSACGRGSTMAVFTSGGTIALLVAQVLGLSPQHAYTFYEPVFNASITRLLFQPGRVSLSGFNDIAHLERPVEPGAQTLLSYR